MNIYQKLVEVRKSVPYLQKDRKGDRFNYVTSSKALGAVREAMDEHGLLLVPRLKNMEVVEHMTQMGYVQHFTLINMEYIWVNAENPEETIVCTWAAQGIDDAEKGIGKAFTYSEKYFLLKFFNVPTDKDDPDSFQEASRGSSPQPQPNPPTIPPEKVCASYVAIINDSPSLGHLERWFKDNWSSISALPKTYYDKVIKAKDDKKKEFLPSDKEEGNEREKPEGRGGNEGQDTGNGSVESEQGPSS